MPAPLNPNLWPSVLHDEDGNPISPSNPLPVTGPGGAPLEAVITQVRQVQNEETVAPLGAGATFNGADRDCENYESFGISVFLDPDAGQALNCSVVVENSIDGVTWRTVDTISVAGAADASSTLNRVYSVTRKFYRVSVTNNDGGNPLDATEVISMMKPI